LGWQDCSKLELVCVCGWGDAIRGSCFLCLFFPSFFFFLFILGVQVLHLFCLFPFVSFQYIFYDFFFVLFLDIFFPLTKKIHSPRAHITFLSHLTSSLLLKFPLLSSFFLSKGGGNAVAPFCAYPNPCRTLRQCTHSALRLGTPTPLLKELHT